MPEDVKRSGTGSREPRRAYSSKIRAEQAAQTRSRIIDAAGDLFTSDGYGRTTIKSIAAAAGVALDTVYAVFGTKVRVLTAVLDARLSPAGVNVMDRPEEQEVRDQPDQRSQIEGFTRDIASLSSRTRPIYEVLRTAGAVEPEAAEVLREMEGHRLIAMGRLADWLAANGPLRVPVERARMRRHVPMPGVEFPNVEDEGPLVSDHAEWMADTLASTLLVDRGERSSTTPAA